MSLAGNLDYALFVEGFCFVVLAIMAWRLPHKGADDLPWRCLAWFGLIHGVYEWLNMLTVTLGESKGFAVLKFAFMAVSFLPLAEFGRRGSRESTEYVPEHGYFSRSASSPSRERIRAWKG